MQQVLGLALRTPLTKKPWRSELITESMIWHSVIVGMCSGRATQFSRFVPFVELPHFLASHYLKGYMYSFVRGNRLNLQYLI